MAADDQGTGSLLQAGGHTEQQQLVAGARAHSPPSAAATSHAPAPGVRVEPAIAASPLPGPVSHGDHVGQSRRGGGGSCSSLSRGSSILSLSDLSSTLQADQEGGSSEGESGADRHEDGGQGGGGVDLRGGESGVDLHGGESGVDLHVGEGGAGLHEGAAALPAPHVDLPALTQDGMRTIKVGVGLGF